MYPVRTLNIVQSIRNLFGVLLVCTLLSSPSFGAEELTEVNLPLAPDERVTSQKQMGLVQNRPIVLLVANSATTARALVVGFQDSGAEILLDITDYIGDQTLISEGGRWASFVPSANELTVLLGDDGKNSGEIWVTDGTAAGTRRIESNTYPGKAIEIERMNSHRQEKLALPFFRYSDQLRGLTHINGKLLLVRGGLEALDLSSGKREELIPPDPTNSIEVRKLAGQSDCLIASLDNEAYTFYRSDGTAQGTSLFSRQPFPRYTPNTTRLYLGGVSNGEDGASVQLFHNSPYFSDGTAAGTRYFNANQLPDACPDDGGIDADMALQLGDRLIYPTCYAQGERAIASYDLLSGESRRIFMPAGSSLELSFSDARREPKNYTLDGNLTLNGRIRTIPYFRQAVPGSLDTTTSPLELWRTDGTVEGTFSLGESATQPPKSEVMTISKAYGFSLIRYTNSTGVFTDGTLSQTFKALRFSRFSAMNFDSFLSAEHGDYLLYLAQDEDRVEKRAELSNQIALTEFDPRKSQFRSVRLLSYPKNSIANKFQAKTFTSFFVTEDQIYLPILNYSGNDRLFDRFLYFRIARDACPNDDLKFVPGVCGCGTEEAPLRLDEQGLVAPGSTICRTSAGPILINPEYVPDPKVGQPVQSEGHTLLSLAFPQDLLSQISRQLELAALDSSEAVAIVGLNSRIASSARITHKVRVIRIRNDKSSSVAVRNTSGGRSELRIRGGLRKSDQLFFDYSFDAFSPDSRRLLSSSNIREGEIRVKSSTRKKKSKRFEQRRTP